MLSGGLGSQIASFGLGFTPAGVGLDVATLITGRDVITNEPVSRLWGVAGIIPRVSEFRKAGNALDGAVDMARGARETGDTHVATEWKPSGNSRDAFKDESLRIDGNGGAKSEQNYNKIESPGKKYRSQDGG
jgi:hypothetical protein